MNNERRRDPDAHLALLCMLIGESLRSMGRCPVGLDRLEP